MTHLDMVATSHIATFRGVRRFEASLFPLAYSSKDKLAENANKSNHVYKVNKKAL